MPLVITGAALRWFGWFGFNGGAASSAGEAGLTWINTLAAPASAKVVGLVAILPPVASASPGGASPSGSLPE